jgi:hypothetical protein
MIRLLRSYPGDNADKDTLLTLLSYMVARIEYLEEALKEKQND